MVFVVLFSPINNKEGTPKKMAAQQLLPLEVV
jgi:hypothetical protein